MKRLYDVTLYIQTLESYSKACDEPDMDNVLATIQLQYNFVCQWRNTVSKACTFHVI